MRTSPSPLNLYEQDVRRGANQQDDAEAHEDRANGAEQQHRWRNEPFS